MHVSRAGDLAEYLGWELGRGWYVAGFDTFAHEWYPHLDFNGAELIPVYATEEEARNAAHAYLHDLEKTQPSKQSGGQRDEGIQDRVFILAPDGMLTRVYPVPECRACPSR